VNLVDANVLLYARNSASERHDRSLQWLDEALSGREPVGLAWISLLAFLRLSTKVALFPRPLEVPMALDQIRSWLASPAATVVEATSRHFDVLAGLLTEAGTGGNLVNDGHLAALAVEHDATVISFDHDFGRFPGVRWREPA
jgi:toxin-antitoxin system PIN domain toxin